MPSRSRRNRPFDGLMHPLVMVGATSPQLILPYTSPNPSERWWHANCDDDPSALRLPPSFGTRAISAWMCVSRCSGRSCNGSPLRPAGGSPPSLRERLCGFRRRWQAESSTPACDQNHPPAALWDAEPRRVENSAGNVISQLLQRRSQSREPNVPGEAGNVLKQDRPRDVAPGRSARTPVPGHSARRQAGTDR